jgi:hypothetical protein
MTSLGWWFIPDGRKTVYWTKRAAVAAACGTRFAPSGPYKSRKSARAAIPSEPVFYDQKSSDG